MQFKPNTVQYRTSKKAMLMIGLIGLIGLLLTGNAMAIENPQYTVTEKTGEFELRLYEPKIIAEVEVSGDMDEASSRGFRLIADFIFGNNTSSKGDVEKISMTAPVTMEAQQGNNTAEKISMTAPVAMAQSGEQWLVHFVMPSDYTIATLPKPNNPAVKIREIPAKNYAVLRFSGFTGADKVDEKTNELLQWMTSKGIKPQGQPELARYNRPFTPPFMRRNEVMVAY